MEVPDPPDPPAGPLPRPNRRRLGAAVTLNATCEGCHRAEAAEWRRSRHRAAHTNAAYQRALAIEPSAFCRACHAPEADPRRPPPPAIGAMGIGCVTCHVIDDGAVLAAPSPRSGGEEIAPHRVRRSPAFGASGACAACHEFHFPAARGDDDGSLMQTTAREHARSKSADRSCADCHMPRVEGRRSHTFAEVRDPAWLGDHLRVTAARTAEDRLQITIAQEDPGHGYPTGDLFRRVQVGAEVRAAGGKVTARAAAYLGRRFEIVAGRPGRTLTADTRVFDDPKIVELAIGPGAAGATVTWWVTLQRVATAGQGDDPETATIESEARIQRGTMEWGPAEAR